MHKEVKISSNVKDINKMVEAREEVRDKLEWARDHAGPEEFSEMINRYDYLNEQITDYYIKNFHAVKEHS